MSPRITIAREETLDEIEADDAARVGGNSGYYRVGTGGRSALRAPRPARPCGLMVRLQNLTDGHYTEVFRARGLDALAGVKVHFRMTRERV